MGYILAFKNTIIFVHAASILDIVIKVAYVMMKWLFASLLPFVLFCWKVGLVSFILVEFEIWIS